LDAFGKGIDIPLLHYVFYDFFYRSSIGDKRWAARCEDEGGDQGQPMGTEQDEALAWVLLENNYFAWLLDLKTKDDSKKVVTDYDSAAMRSGKQPLTEGYFKTKLELDLDPKIEEEENNDPNPGALGEVDEDSDSEEGGSSANKKQSVVVYADDDRFEDLKKKTEAMLKRNYTDASRHLLYNLVKAHVSSENAAKKQRLEQEGGRDETEEEKKEREKNKTKLMKTLRLYTTRKGNEAPFKGYSPKRTSAKMREMIGMLREKKVGHRKRFRMAYRSLYRQNKKEKNKNNNPEVPNMLERNMERGIISQCTAVCLDL
jgi:hypothetical protein